MRPILDTIIDPIQSAFVAKCSIHDNILLTHILINKFKNMKRKRSRVALKFDTKKACNRFNGYFSSKNYKV